MPRVLSKAMYRLLVAMMVLAAPARAALVARFTFDDPAHLNADTSGNHNSPGVYGNPSACVGRSGGAVTFAGDSYFQWEGTNHPMIKLLRGSFTVCVWVKTTQVFGSDTAAPYSGAGIVWADYPGMPPIGDAIPLALTGSKASGWAACQPIWSTTSINTGEWVHLAFVRYASTNNGYVRLYVNGQLEATGACGGAIASDAGIMAIGANILDGRYFRGSLDDLRFYDTPLSDFEIVAAAGAPIVVGNLLMNPGFEFGSAGWFAMGSGALTTTASLVHSGAAAALVQNRTATWNGPGQLLLNRLETNRTYTVTGWVRVDGSISQTVALTVKKVDGSGTSYSTIATKSIPVGVWTQLQGTYSHKTTGLVSDLFFYVDGPSAGVALYADDLVFLPQTFNAPPSLLSPRWDPLNQQFTFQIAGPVGKTCIVETSTNLTRWDTLLTATNNTGTLSITNSASGFPRHFFRVLQAP